MSRPNIVCLCGSTRFYDDFQRANFEETMHGSIVLSVGFYPHGKDRPATVDADGRGWECGPCRYIAGGLSEDGEAARKCREHNREVHHTGDKHVTDAEKHKLDMLHLHKIDLASEVLVLNRDGYIGESTARELAYAVFCHKPVRFLDRTAGEQYMIRERHALGKLIATFLEGLPHLLAG